MALHNRRNRLAKLAEREAAGESFWTDNFDSRARGRIEHALKGSSQFWYEYASHARGLILQDEGIRHLRHPSLYPAEDFVQFLELCDHDMMPTVVEAIYAAMSSPQLAAEIGEYNDDEFVERVNEILREERIAWELLDGEMTPFTSRELHVEVVVPTLRLLARPGWEKVEAAYQDALGELAAGNAPDAITDAGTALQEALTLLGAQGKALGSLISSAQGKGIIRGHDQALMEVVARASTWVSADRSQLGESHLVSDAERADAWLTVHVVGAILVRLSEETNRPG